MRFLSALFVSALALSSWVGRVHCEESESLLEEGAESDEVELEMAEPLPNPYAHLLNKDENETIYSPPPPPSDAIFVDTFSSPLDFAQRWVKSGDSKYAAAEMHVGNTSQPDAEVSSSYPHLPGESTLFFDARAQHYGVSAWLSDKHTPFHFEAEANLHRSFIVQYEVRFNKDHTCGGAYLKLIQSGQNFDPHTLTGATPYSIMFGPDRCGDNDRVHFIFRFPNPVTGSVEEKHLKSPPKIRNDRSTHLYTLILRPDNDEYEVKIDGVSQKRGSLLTDFVPAVEPPTEIDDPNEKKPADWVDKQMIADPEDQKPEGWDDIPSEIPDPDAQKPEDWNDEMDGDWEPPNVPNPAFKGEWKPRMVSNPAYKGEWKPTKIKNPAHFVPNDIVNNLLSIEAVGFEVWTMLDGIEFDNIIITQNEGLLDKWTKATFDVKQKYELERTPEHLKPKEPIQETLFDKVRLYVNKNLIAVVVSSFVGVLTLVVGLYLCCCRSSPRAATTAAASTTATSVPSASTAAAQAAIHDDDESDEDREEEQDSNTKQETESDKPASESDSSPTPSTVKRTKPPRAD